MYEEDICKLGTVFTAAWHQPGHNKCRPTDRLQGPPLKQSGRDFLSNMCMENVQNQQGVK